MKLAVLSTALLKEVDLSVGADRPEFRKATRKMKYCLGVAELTLKRLPENLLHQLQDIEYKNMCTILGTSMGEIEVTREFLVTLDQSGMARPILFQNSLHNAVNGFITMALGLRGPSITVSHRFMTSENALESAQLLMSPSHPFGLVICSEIIVEDFMPGYSKIYPQGVKLRDGASAVFLATEDAVEKLGLEPLGWIKEITPGARGVFSDNEYYDSNGLEKIILSGLKSQIRLCKPDGSSSTVNCE